MSRTLRNGLDCRFSYHHQEIQFPSVSVPQAGRSGVIAIYSARKAECSYTRFRCVILEKVVTCIALSTCNVKSESTSVTVFIACTTSHCSTVGCTCPTNENVSRVRFYQGEKKTESCGRRTIFFRLCHYFYKHFTQRRACVQVQRAGELPRSG